VAREFQVRAHKKLLFFLGIVMGFAQAAALRLGAQGVQALSES
jgi:hypothetical protein